MKSTPILSIISLLVSISLSAMGLLDPKNDPEVNPHLERGYFELKEKDQPQSGMTLQEVEKIRDDFLAYAKPLLVNESRKLNIQISWDNPYYTAHARYKTDELYIGLWGGFLRAPGMNLAIVTVTFCHELGHLIGGKPKQTVDKSENISTEGQSDFFAALSCTHDFLRVHPEYAPTISQEVSTFCEGQKDCENSLEAGLQTFSFLQKWGFTPYEPVSIRKRAAKTEIFIPNTYPVYQCRMDSFTQAAACLKKEGHAKSCAPPSCWWPETMTYPPQD